MVQMLCAAMLAAVTSPAVVPAPQEMKVNEGSFSLNAKTLEQKDYRYTLDKSLPKEGYRLSISAGGIAVASSDAAGRFYAEQTLRQLGAVKDGKLA